MALFFWGAGKVLFLRDDEVNVLILLIFIVGACVCSCVGRGRKTELIATGVASVTLLEESSRQSFGCVVIWAGSLE